MNNKAIMGFGFRRIFRILHISEVVIQTDGVAMGSPLAPVLANLFLGHHEKRWLENYNS